MVMEGIRNIVQGGSDCVLLVRMSLDPLLKALDLTSCVNAESRSVQSLLGKCWKNKSLLNSID